MVALTAHFSEEELRVTGAPLTVRSNAMRLARETLEPIRAALRTPMHITSGYRAPSHNAAVGGSETSQHMDGTAADFGTELSLRTVAELLVVRWPMPETRPWGQLILYPYTTQHVHVSLPTRGKRGEMLVKLGGETGGYASFSLASFPAWHRRRERGADSGRTESAVGRVGCCGNS